MRRFLRIFTYVILAGVGFTVGWVRLPYQAQGPGPARDVFPLIRVEGHPRYESTGRLLVTTVRYEQVTPLEALFVWIDPSRALIPNEELFPPGVGVQQETARAISQMDQSKIDAASVVLRELTDYPDEHGEGALIETVFPGCPADGRLFPGDVVSAVDGRRVRSPEEASAAIDAADPNAALTFRVSAAGDTHDVRVGRDACVPDDPTPYVGISTVAPFPFDISISSGDIGGSSAGLMWAVGLYDLMTPGDLLDGRTIAGTGTIDLDGKVGAIDGIRDKVRSAVRAGASLFLAPVANLAALEDMGTGDMRIVSVSSLDDAVRALG